jgi:hypothetical protein
MKATASSNHQNAPGVLVRVTAKAMKPVSFRVSRLRKFLKDEERYRMTIRASLP